MAFWKLEDGEAIKMGSFAHKAQGTWTPQWTSDESYMGRMVSSEVQFFKSESLDRVAFRIQADNIGTFSISPGPYPKVAIFIKEAKVKIHKVPQILTFS